jgi:hypothetical protein
LGGLPYRYALHSFRLSRPSRFSDKEHSAQSSLLNNLKRNPRALSDVSTGQQSRTASCRAACRRRRRGAADDVNDDALLLSASDRGVLFRAARARRISLGALGRAGERREKSRAERARRKAEPLAAQRARERVDALAHVGRREEEQRDAARARAERRGLEVRRDRCGDALRVRLAANHIRAEDEVKEGLRRGTRSLRALCLARRIPGGDVANCFRCGSGPARCRARRGR